MKHDSNPLHLTREELHALLTTPYHPFVPPTVELPTLQAQAAVHGAEDIRRRIGTSTVCACCILRAARTGSIVCPYFRLCASPKRPDRQSVIFLHT